MIDPITPDWPEVGSFARPRGGNVHIVTSRVFGSYWRAACGKIWHNTSLVSANEDGGQQCQACREATTSDPAIPYPDGYDEDGHEASLRRMTPIDLGHEHAIGWTPTGDLWWLHRCTGPSYCGDLPSKWALGTIDVTSGTKHELRKRLPVYVGGSVLCVACGDHGFINNGKWVPA